MDMNEFAALAEVAGLSQDEVARLISERAWQRIKKDLPP
jgi:hypothetical protein